VLNLSLAAPLDCLRADSRRRRGLPLYARLLSICDSDPLEENPIMSKPLVISIPHRLGKNEAIRRLKSGLGSVRTNFGHVFSVQEESWTGDQLRFRVGALGQFVSGTIDVAEDYVQLEMMLPWLLAQFAEKLSPAIQRQGVLLLDKK